MIATAVGSMPGTDIDEACRVVHGEIPACPALPELPARGPSAGLVGRGVAVLVGLPAELRPSGWQTASADGLDQRRARTLLRSDLDAFTEHGHGLDTAVKAQIAGPLTLSAMVERPAGGALLADPGARRDLAASLAEGVAAHVGDLRDGFPEAGRLVVQLDEPMLPQVLAGRVRTASGFSTYRALASDDARDMLRTVLEAAARAGAATIVHSCAREIDVALLHDAGADAVSVDLDMVAGADGSPLRRTDTDAWGSAIEAGLIVYAGLVPTTAPARPATAVEMSRRLVTVAQWMGVDEESLAGEGPLGVTPACGLAGASPGWAREALALGAEVARNLSDVDAARQDDRHE